MPQRVVLIPVGAEHAPCIGDRGAKLQERCRHLLAAGIIPIGEIEDLERTGIFYADLDGILQGVDLSNIFFVCVIGKHPVIPP